ncbi:lipopolysaccharide biosynthesis protein, partial [Chloroflexota bacterium]
YMSYYLLSFLGLLFLSIVSPVKLLPRHLAISWVNIKGIFRAGFANWLPAVLLALGGQSGILILYGTQTAIETGYYFIAYTIIDVLLTIQRAIWVVLFPTLSGSDHEKHNTMTWTGMRLGLAIIIPASVCVLLNYELILGFFGEEFLVAVPMLAIMITTPFFITITKGIETLVYAQGKYNQVLLFGFITNIPRLALYLALVPTHGGNGAAVSFLAGGICGFVFSLVIAVRETITIRWHKIAVIILIPLGVAASSYLLNIHSLIGTFILLVITAILYIKFNIIQRDEVKLITGYIRRAMQLRGQRK